MWTQLSRAAKSWKFVFFNYGFRRDVRPRGLSLQGTIPSLSAMVFSCPGGAFFKAICSLKDVASSCSSRSRSSAAATAKVAAAAAYSRSRAAGRPCGHSCQELPRAGTLCSLTRVSEGTLGLVDYHCRAPFRPSVPWCFPVREVRFFLRQYIC